LGLKSEIKERIVNDRYDANTILHFYIGDKKITFEDIKKGMEVEKGTVIGFAITERGDNFISIPDLSCNQFERAEFLIQGYQLVLGNIIADATVTDRATAFVYKQVPAFDPTQKMRIGEQIELYLTQSRPIDCPLEELDPFAN
jgi:D-alanine-D-alanine ligase